MIELPNVTSLYVLLAFGVSYAILKRYLFVPLSGILEAREREEREAQKAYAESLEALEKAVAAGEQKLSLARREALKTREELRSEGAALLEHEARRSAGARLRGDRPRQPRDRGPGVRILQATSRAGQEPRARARGEDPRPKARRVTLLALPSTALSAALLFSTEEGEHASSFLGLPLTVWQVLNLVLFLAVLLYFVAKPMSAAFRKRQEEIEERRRRSREAAGRRGAALRRHPGADGEARARDRGDPQAGDRRGAGRPGRARRAGRRGSGRVRPARRRKRSSGAWRRRGRTSSARPRT